MSQGVSEARFLGRKISYSGWTDTYFEGGGGGNTTEEPLGIQDLLQAECFPAEPEKTTVSPNGNSVFITSLHLLWEKIELLWFFVFNWSPNISKQTWHLSVFLSVCLLTDIFVERKILSNWTPVWHNTGEIVLSFSLIYINTSFINCQYGNNLSCKI